MSMRDKIARALEEALTDAFSNAITYAETGEGWPETGDFHKAADAVLNAMREPTEEMIVAGIIERHDSETPEAWKLATANIYTAMIDAARDSDTHPQGGDAERGSVHG